MSDGKKLLSVFCFLQQKEEKKNICLFCHSATDKESMFLKNTLKD
jgi:hypothetical protein